jgi:hypothetical protein
MPTARPDVYAIASGASLYAGGGAPAPAPAPSPAASYRTTQPLLWVDVDAATELVLMSDGDGTLPRTPARASVPDPKTAFIWGRYGPTWDHVDLYSKWSWANPGGDWIDAAGTPQGTAQPHFSFAANAVGTGTSPYVVDITTAMQAVVSAGKWCAFIVRVAGGTRALASQHHSTLAAPVVAVTYTSGATAMLQCRGCVRLAPGSAYSRVGFEEAGITPVALQFDRPSGPIASAELRVTVTQHTATPTTIQGFLANPPVNAAPVQQGLAATYPADNGLLAAPGVLVARRYQDGSTLNDWVLPDATINVFSRSAWDPEVLGLGAADTTKLPTAANGVALANKWIQKQPVPAGNLQLVGSSYTGDGFAPLLPGIGALRIKVTGMDQPDGGTYGPVGAFGCDLWTLFPKSVCGTDALRRTFVRFYVRIAGPKPKPIATTKMVRETGGPAEYAYQHGKFGIGVHHWTSRGGNNLTGGGPLGWSNRLGYERPPGDIELQGLVPLSHTVDNGVPDMRWGDGGGLGSGLFTDRWYCVEVETNVNTWAPTGGGPADGELRVWIDGRLASTHTGWKFRDGPPDPAGAGTDLPPFRAMGPMGLAAQWYQGGRLPADEELVMFVTCDVAATSYIGPISAAAAPSLPSWVPAYSDTVANVEVLTTANGRLTNNVSDVNPPNYFLYYQRVVFYAYSGGAFNPHWGSFGAYVYSGAGHSAGNENTAYNLAIGEQCTWSRLNDPTPFYGTGTDPTTQYNNSVGVFSGPPYIDPATCASPIDGQVAGTHTWGSLMVLPPRAGSEKGRVFMPWAMVASYYPPSGICSFTSHSISITSESTPSASRKWQAEYTSPTLPSGLGWNSLVGLPGLAVYDEPSKRVMLIHRRNSPVMWYDDTPGFVGDRFVSGTGTRLDLADSNSGGGPPAHAVAVPERRLAVMVYRKAGQSYLSAQTLDMSLAQPAWNNTPANFTAQIPVDADWSCVAWSSLAQRLVIGDVQGDRAKLWLVEIPTILSNPWVCTPVTMSQPCTRWRAPGSRSADNVTDFGKWAENPHTRCFIFFNKYPSATEHVDEVFAIRLPGI